MKNFKSDKKMGATLIRMGFLVVLAGTFFIACQSNSSSGDSEKETASEEGQWVDLFDGKSFEGWRTLGSDSVFTAYWKIDNGILKKVDRGTVPARADGQPQEGGDLMTKKAFDNFELSWEWALFADGNSGLKYNVSEEMSMEHGSKHSALGFEYQMLDDLSNEYGDLKPSQFSGSLYDLLPGENAELKPMGEFNSSRLLIDGHLVEHWLNGKKVLSYTFDSTELQSAYESSKFAKIPGFINKRKGHIVLQDHITEAWFRNIKIRTL